MSASLLEEGLDRLLRSGWVALVWRFEGTRRALRWILLLDRKGLEDFAHPGRESERSEALAAASAVLSGVDHPVAVEVRRVIAEERDVAADPRLVRAFAAIARHVQGGEVLPARVFAARHLGSSKALEPLRARLERALGSLEALGIRDGGAATFLGGAGRVVFAAGELDLARLGPFIGVARDLLKGGLSLDVPAAGVLLAENFAVFEACCRGEIADLRNSLVVWTAGYPGRAVRAVVEAAERCRAPVRAWADLDLDGVRIVRLANSWAPRGVEAFRMSPADLAAAAASLPLSARAAAAIRADLAARPNDLLSETLTAILELGRWVEQEAFLGGS